MQKVKIEPFKLIGISVRTTNKNNQAAKDIANLWQRFMGESLLAKIPHKIDESVYSLYTDYEGDHTQPYTAILGCRVDKLDDIPDGMAGKSFGGGTYVTLSERGDLMNGMIVKQWEKIFGMELNRAYMADFEVFGEKARNPSDAEVDFYVSVR